MRKRSRERQRAGTIATVVYPNQRNEPGAPRQVSVAADGARVVFLRSAGPQDPTDRLWVYEVAKGTEQQVAAAPEIATYATDLAASAAVFVSGGQLHRADLTGDAVTTVSSAESPRDPQLDPTGHRIGYLAGGGLHIIDASGGDTLLAGEPDPAEGGHSHVTWGVAEPAAVRHFGRDRGWWWAPDGHRVLVARVDRARAPRTEVSLHLLDLDGSWVDVHWDRETYPYLVSVSWADHADPLIAVLRRPQQHGLVLAVDSRTGETQVHAELADPRWVEPIPGTPCHLADGRVLVGGELAHDGYDARCLFADGTLLTPPSLYVRRVVGKLPGAAEILVEASEGEPSEQHLYRVATSAGTAGIDARRITAAPGWHQGAVGGETLVIGSESLDHPGTQWTVWRGDAPVSGLTSAAPAPEAAPRPVLQRVTDRRLPTGVLYPRSHVTGRRLPVLVNAGIPDQGVRAARAAWLDAQWWADAGFAVVVVDHRGTPGVAPSFEKVVHRRLADLTLADLTEALAALSGKHPDLDLGLVGIRGRGVGGWLAGLAALRRPELFRCAVAETPVVDWAHYDEAFTQRYLGMPDDGVEVYQHHSLLAAAVEPRGDAGDLARPLLLVPDRDDDPRVAQLAGALLVAGRPHTVLPAPASDDESRRAEVDFLHRHLT